jgi:hypothetical protein
MKHRKKLALLGCSFSLTFGLLANTYAATSDTTSSQVSVQSGSLAITTPSASVDFGTVTVDGTVQTVTASLGTMNASDYRGTGEGWNVTVQATQFSQTIGAMKTLPQNSLTLTSVDTISASDGNSSPVPTSPAGPFIIDGVSSVNILSAALSEGMGAYDVTFPANVLELAVDTSAGVVDAANNPTVYTSTVTWTIATGP